MYIQTHNQILRSVSQGESTFEAESIGKIHFTILKQWYSKIWQICLLNKIYFAPFLISVYVYWSGADACEFPFGKVLFVCTFYLILILLLRVFVVVAQFPNGNFHNSVWERKIERGRPNERASETQWKSLCRQIRPSRLTPIHWLSDPRLLNDSQATAEASAAVSSSSSCPLISFLLHMHTQTHTAHSQQSYIRRSQSSFCCGSAASVAVDFTLSQKERTVAVRWVPKSPMDCALPLYTCIMFATLFFFALFRSLYLSLSRTSVRCLRLWLFEFLISLARDGACEGETDGRTDVPTTLTKRG